MQYQSSVSRNAPVGGHVKRQLHDTQGGGTPAGFWLRFFAAWYDNIIVGIFVTIVMIGVVLISGSAAVMYAEQLKSVLQSGFVGLRSGAAIFLALLIFPVAAAVLYGALFESSHFAATPGKLLLGLYVADRDSCQLSFSQAFCRNLYKWVGQGIMIGSWVIGIFSMLSSGPGVMQVFIIVGGSILGFLVYVIGHVMVAFSANKQALHDRWSDCYVDQRTDFSRTQRAICGSIVIIFTVASFFFTPHEKIRDDFAGKMISSQMGAPFKFRTHSRSGNAVKTDQTQPSRQVFDPSLHIDLSDMAPARNNIAEPPAPEAQPRFTGTVSFAGREIKVGHAVARLTSMGRSVEVAVFDGRPSGEARRELLRYSSLAVMKGEVLNRLGVKAGLILNFDPFSKVCSSFSLRTFRVLVPDPSGALVIANLDASQRIAGYWKFSKCSPEPNGALEFIISGEAKAELRGVMQPLKWDLDLAMRFEQ